MGVNRCAPCNTDHFNFQLIHDVVNHKIIIKCCLNDTDPIPLFFHHMIAFIWIRACRVSTKPLHNETGIRFLFLLKSEPKIDQVSVDNQMYRFQFHFYVIFIQFANFARELKSYKYLCLTHFTQITVQVHEWQMHQFEVLKMTIDDSSHLNIVHCTCNCVDCWLAIVDSH